MVFWCSGVPVLVRAKDTAPRSSSHTDLAIRPPLWVVLTFRPLLAVLTLIPVALTACSKTESPGDGGTSGRSTSRDKGSTEITTKSGVSMVSIPAGQFTMGSDQ